MTTTTSRSRSADAIVSAAGKLKNPSTRLGRIAEARIAHTESSTRLAAATADAITAAREAGMTWAAIGAALDVSAQRAQQLVGS